MICYKSKGLTECLMMSVTLYVFTKCSIGIKSLRPNPRQQNNKNMNLNEFKLLWTIFTRKNAPAANLKCNKNVKSSPDFT